MLTRVFCAFSPGRAAGAAFFPRDAAPSRHGLRADLKNDYAGPTDHGRQPLILQRSFLSFPEAATLKSDLDGFPASVITIISAAFQSFLGFVSPKIGCAAVSPPRSSRFSGSFGQKS